MNLDKYFKNSKIKCRDCNNWNEEYEICEIESGTESYYEICGNFFPSEARLLKDGIK